jgi:two-component system cell cycle sensor histidine kinase/response regulator CckA
MLKSGAHTTEFYQGMWNKLTRGETWSGHVTNRRKDGKLSEEEVVISPVRDASGAIVNYVAVKRDMSHEMEIERQLIHAQKMESLGLLAGGIAHDFNNVLAVIQGSITFLEREITDSRLQKFLEMSRTSVDRGADVVKRLLSFSRHGDVQHIPVSLFDVTKELIQVLEHTIEKTITIEAVVPRDVPAVEGDYGQLYQMLLNLCINARDAIIDPQGGRETGTIRIVASTIDGSQLTTKHPEATQKKYVRISVSDTGIGLTKEMQEKVFQPFFTTKPVGKGTGLGLSVVYTIIQSHNGFVDLESEIGKGATFHLYLPALEMEKRLPLQGVDMSILEGHETILIVEDEEAVGSMLEEFLSSIGYSVLKALNGVDGIQMFVKHRNEIRLIVADINMPRLSGYEMFMRIRDIDPEAKVVLASGYLDSELKRKLLEAGAYRFISKPYTPMIVAKTIREVLDSPESRS